MMRLISFLLACLAAFAAPPAAAQVATLHARTVIVCPAEGDEAPTFKEAGCKEEEAAAIDPQGRHIWVRAVIEAPASYEGARPLGLFVAAKAASEAFLNGVRLGANGAPAASAGEETPGKMDAVFAIPDGLLRAGANAVDLRLSSHHGRIAFVRPVHIIAIGPYADPTAWLLGQYWPSLVTFGALIAGAFYFAAASITGAKRAESALLAALSFFAAGQLLVEAYRGLSAYPYPVHEIRVTLIVATSLGFGASLAALSLVKFAPKNGGRWFALITALMIAAIFLARGFDAKAAFAVLTATIASAAIAARAAIKRSPQALLYAVTLSAFAATILLFPALFLDSLFFFQVAALILCFFIAEAFAIERERREREAERLRAHELEAALERAAARETPATVRVNAAGSLTIVNANDITYCKGAGDYVELVLKDGRVILHNGALAELEETLPATFLRVHRSFIVNTAFVKALTRESTGVGALALTTGAEVPVSRRIMPKVRSALG
jgi:DNA-binding LytR/AlgR family response regulator